MADYLALARRALGALPQSIETPESSFKASAQEVRLWFEVRCERRRGVWSSEQCLWRDYDGWCEQTGRAPCVRELFCRILSRSFTRKEDGWQGIVLTAYLAGIAYIM